MKIHICAPDIHPNDAVGNHCFGIARMCARIGVETYLYAQNLPDFYLGVREIGELKSNISPDDLLFVSYSIYDPYLDSLLDFSGRKICYFHGVTDPDLLLCNEPETAVLCEKAIEQLPKIGFFDHIIVNSLHTAKTLKPYIFLEPTVIPPIFRDMPVFSRSPITVDTPKRKNLLVIGRVAPHKRVEDAILLLAGIRETEYKYTMTVVGHMPNPKYSKFLFNYARDLGVIESVFFTGRVTSEDLFDLYLSARAYLSMSQHEGFCVPVLEAMHFGLPVFVHEGTAAQETAGEAGIIVGHCREPASFHTITSTLDSLAQISRQIAKGMQRETVLLEATSDDVWRQVFEFKRGTND